MKWSQLEGHDGSYITYLVKPNGEVLHHINIQLNMNRGYTWKLHRPEEERFLLDKEVTYYLQHPDELYMEDLL